MKTILFPISIGALAVLATACQVNPQALRQIDPSEDTLMASRAGGVVDLTNDSVPNPTGLEGISTRSERLISRYFREAGDHCEGYVARQTAMTIIADEVMPDIRFSTHGEAEILMIEEPDGTTRCEVASGGPVIAGRDWAPGTYRVYVGTTEKNKRFTYDLIFEDFERPVTLPWLEDDEMPTVMIQDTMEEPGHVSVDTKSQRFSSRSARHGNAECATEELTFPMRPSLRIVVEEATSIDLTALSDGESTINLVGPIPESRRDIPTKCLPPQNSKIELEAGEYFVRLGVDDEATPDAIDLIVRDSRGTGAAGFLATAPAEGMPVHAREVRKHFPFATAANIWQRDSLRAQIFADAPDELLVGIAQTPQDAEIYRAQDSEMDSDEDRLAAEEAGEAGEEMDQGPQYRHEEVVWETPAAGEVVLLIEDNRVLTADGLIFSLSRDVLVPAEDLDEISLPSTPRNPHLTLDETMERSTGDDERRAVSDFLQLWYDFESCRDGEWTSVEDQLQQFEDAGEFDDADELRAETEETIREFCEQEEAEMQRTTLWESLENSRQERRSSILSTNRERIEALFR